MLEVVGGWWRLLKIVGGCWRLLEVVGGCWSLVSIGYRGPLNTRGEGEGHETSRQCICDPSPLSHCNGLTLVLSPHARYPGYRGKNNANQMGPPRIDKTAPAHMGGSVTIGLPKPQRPASLSGICCYYFNQAALPTGRGFLTAELDSRQGSGLQHTAAFFFMQGSPSTPTKVLKHSV